MIAKKIQKNQSYAKSSAQDASDLCRYIINARSHMTDRPTQTQEPEKVLCTGALNFAFESTDARISEMAGLAAQARSGDPVSHYVLSWPSSEQPSETQLHEAARIFAREMGVANHQIIYGAHKNTDNIHLHLAINRVDPVTLKVVKINKGFDKLAAHRAICVIENVQGWQREKNAVYSMTQDGPALNQREKGLSDAARAAEQRTGETSLERRARALAPEIALATSWQDLHLRLAAHGISYEKRKGGAVIKFGNAGFIKASLAGRECSLRNLEKRFNASFERAHIIAKPYEPTPPQIRKNANIADLLLAMLLKLFGFHAAARQILYTKQALERDELKQAKFQNAQTRWAAQSVLKEEHAAQRAALAKEQEKEITAVKSMSKEELIAYCEEKQLLEKEPSMNRKEIFERFSEALGAERYRITSKLDVAEYGMSAQDVNRRSFVFGKQEDVLAGIIQADQPSRGYTATEVAEHMQKISAYGDKSDRGTYVTPISSNTHYIVIDDIKTQSQLDSVCALAPAYLGESSRGSFQAVLKVRACEDAEIAQIAANKTTAELNQKFGDPAVRNGQQPFRLPGFENHKLKHVQDGVSPVVKMHYAEPVFSEKVQAIYNNYVELQRVNVNEQAQVQAAAPAQAQSAPGQQITEWSPKGARYIEIYGIHAKDCAESMQRAGYQAPTGRNFDYAISIRLRACGYSEAETAKIISFSRLYNDIRKGDTEHQGVEIEEARGAAIAHSAYHTDEATKQMIKESQHVTRWLQREKSAIKEVRALYEKENIAAPEIAEKTRKQHQLSR